MIRRLESSYLTNRYVTLTSDLSPTRRALLAGSALATTSLLFPFAQASGQPARSPLNGEAVLTGSLRSSPEARLIAVYRAIAAGDRQALPLAAALVRDVPGFQLGQLVYADLLLARSGSFPGLTSATDGPPAVREQLQKLRAEAQRRLNALSEMPPPGTVPEQLLRLAPHVRHVVVVDASHSRGYVVVPEALLSNSIKGRTTPDPRRSYPTRTVSGVPSSVKRLRMAARTCSSAT